MVKNLKESKTGAKVSEFLLKYRIPTIFTFALSLRLINLISLKLHFPFYDLTLRGLDQDTYHDWAQKIIAGDWLSSEIKIFYYGPLYAYFLAILYKIFGLHFWVIYFVQAMLGALSSVLILLIGERLFGKTAGWISGFVAAVCATFIFYDGLLLMEELILFLLMAYLWVFLRANESPQHWFLWLISGALLTLAAIGRGNSLLLIPVSTGWLVYQSIKKKAQRQKFLLATALFLCASFLTLLPVSLHNRIFGGKWVLTTSNAPVLLFIGNVNDNKFGTLTYTPTYYQVQKKYAGQQEIPWIKELIADIQQYPTVFLRNLLFKSFLFLNGYDYPDNINFYLSRQLLPVLKYNPVDFHLIFSFGLLGIVLAILKPLLREKITLMLIVLGCLASSIILMFVVGRYRLPFLGAIIPLFAFFILQMHSFILQRKFRPFIGFLLIGVIAYIALGLFPKNPIRYNDYAMFGTAYLSKGNYWMAEQHYLSSLKIYPTYINAIQNLLYIYAKQRREKDGERLIQFALNSVHNKAEILTLAIAFHHELGNQARASHYYKLFQDLSSSEKK